MKRTGGFPIVYICVSGLFFRPVGGSGDPKNRAQKFHLEKGAHFFSGSGLLLFFAFVYPHLPTMLSCSSFPPPLDSEAFASDRKLFHVMISIPLFVLAVIFLVFFTLGKFTQVFLPVSVIHCPAKYFKKQNFPSPLGCGIGHFGMLPSPSRLRPIPRAGGVLAPHGLVHRGLPPTTRSPPWTPRWPTACSGRPSWSLGPRGKNVGYSALRSGSPKFNFFPI